MDYDPTRVGTDAMLKAISEVGFIGRLVDEPAANSTTPGVTLDLAALPEKLATVFKQAASESRFVLIDVHGPG